jgi:hypothetical protein
LGVFCRVWGQKTVWRTGKTGKSFASNADFFCGMNDAKPFWGTVWGVVPEKWVKGIKWSV